nr:hypothetical protein [Plantactinospora alkalitolerans]
MGELFPMDVGSADRSGQRGLVDDERQLRRRQREDPPLPFGEQIQVSVAVFAAQARDAGFGERRRVRGGLEQRWDDQWVVLVDLARLTLVVGVPQQAGWRPVVVPARPAALPGLAAKQQ